MGITATRYSARNICLLGILALTSVMLYASDVLAFSIVNPTAANHKHRADDPAGDSKVLLKPDPVKSLSSVSQALKDELAGGDTSFAGWTFDYTFTSLNGTLYVDLYKAGYKAAHHGGGEINLRYKKGTGDPTNLRWVQLITTNNPIGGATSPYIDPYPNDDDAVDGPFYYCDPPGNALCDKFDISKRVNGNTDYGFGKDYSLHFYDFSSRTHPLPVPFPPITWRAELYLVEWDGAKKVTFHNGIEWGWEMTPTPEPSTLVLLASGLAGCLAVGYYRRNPRPE
jgi:hypothetical protein